VEVRPAGIATRRLEVSPGPPLAVYLFVYVLYDTVTRLLSNHDLVPGIGTPASDGTVLNGEEPTLQ